MRSYIAVVFVFLANNHYEALRSITSSSAKLIGQNFRGNYLTKKFQGPFFCQIQRIVSPTAKDSLSVLGQPDDMPTANEDILGDRLGQDHLTGMY